MHAWRCTKVTKNQIDRIRKRHKRSMNDSHQSSDPNQTLVDTNVESATTPSVATLREQLRPALLSVFLLTFLTGVMFPMGFSFLRGRCSRRKPRAV